jgi:methylamine dehydrogenase accessory protein MauD
MSSAWFTVSYVALWAVVALQAVVLLAVFRQLGVLHGRVGPRGGVRTEDTPRVGSVVPSLTFTALDGTSFALVDGHPLTLAVIVHPGCSVCEEVGPSIRTLMRDPPGEVHVLTLVSHDDERSVREFANRFGLALGNVAPAPEISSQLEVENTPLALVLDEEGQVLNSGIVNSLEEMEVLISQARAVQGNEDEDGFLTVDGEHSLASQEVRS